MWHRTCHICRTVRGSTSPRRQYRHCACARSHPCRCSRVMQDLPHLVLYHVFMAHPGAGGLYHFHIMPSWKCATAASGASAATLVSHITTTKGAARQNHAPAKILILPMHRKSHCRRHERKRHNTTSPGNSSIPCIWCGPRRYRDHFRSTNKRLDHRHGGRLPCGSQNASCLYRCGSTGRGSWCEE